MNFSEVLARVSFARYLLVQWETEVARALLGILDVIEGQTSSDWVKLAQQIYGVDFPYFRSAGNGDSLPGRYIYFRHRKHLSPFPRDAEFGQGVSNQDVSFAIHGGRSSALLVESAPARAPSSYTPAGQSPSDSIQTRLLMDFEKKVGMIFKIFVLMSKKKHLDAHDNASESKEGQLR